MLVRNVYKDLFVMTCVFVGNVSHIFRAARGASVQVCVVRNHSGSEEWMRFNLYSTWSF